MSDETMTSFPAKRLGTMPTAGPVAVAESARPSVGAGAPRPRVSVVLAVRNEAPFIEACLERLLGQDYPPHLVDLVVVDGCSDDGTAAIVRDVQRRHRDRRIRLLNNPQLRVAPGLNLGLRAATGEVIVRMDGHTVPDRTYLSACVATLERTGAANVGGVIEAVGTTPFGRAVALAIGHRLGAGDARFRVGGGPGEVDTVPFGAFRRDLFDRIGLYDESMVCNEDYELNARVRAAGERVYLDPTIRSSYTPRGTARELWRQYFRYGWWRVETLRRHRWSLRWRQALPPTFVGGMVALAVAAPWSAWAATLLALCLAGYLVVVGLVGAVLARTASAHPAAVGAAFIILHLAYGSGFLLGLVTGGRIPYRAAPPNVPPLAATSDHRRAGPAAERWDAFVDQQRPVSP